MAMPRGWVSVGLAWICVAVPTVAHAQLLGRVSDAVHAGGDDGQSSSSSSSDDDDDDSGGSLLGSASDAAHGSSSGGYSGSSGGSYGGAPYAALGAGGAIGCPFGQPYVGATSSGGVATDAQVDARLAARLEIEAGYVLAGAGRGGVGARLQLPLLLDLTARYSVFFEPAEEGVLVAALGRIGGELRIVDNRWFQLRVGGGLRHFHDDRGSELGGDFVIGFDAFPGEPIVLSGELAVGAVGRAMVVQARGQVGFIIDSTTEIYAGYDYEALFAGGIQVDLGGPMLGVRAWL